MRTTVLVLSLCCSLVVGPTITAATYKGDCLSTENGKKKVGDIVITSKTIRFESTNHNQEIPVEQITKITAGKFAKKRVKGSIAGAVLLGPLALFALIGKKKREMFAVEYENDEGDRGALIFQVKKRLGFTVETDLEASTGIQVEWQEERGGKQKKEDD